MNTHQEPAIINNGDDAITDNQVAEFLEKHPDFFIRHPSLLDKISIPHDSGDAISLIEYHLKRLRDQNRDMKQKMHEMIDAARENDRLSERILRLALALMDADSIEHTLIACEDILLNDFNADCVVFRLFDPDQELDITRPDVLIPPNSADIGAFSSFFKAGRPLCGRLKKEQLQFLFDEQDDINSSVLLPLGRNPVVGMLAIGSHDADRYHPGMGTMFLLQLATLIGTALESHIKK
jgi:hypothetical protein